MTTADALAYVSGGMHEVEGWFAPLDARLFAATDLAHRQLGVSGELVEVGVFHGKSAILLGLLAGRDERVIAVDLFGAPAPTDEQRQEQARWYPGLGEERFLENWTRFLDDPPRVLSGRSDEQLRTLADRTARLVHIDGAHAFEAVRGDIAQAVRIALPDAVIVLDDILTPHTPGVTAATWEAIFAGDLVPLAQTRSKLYATLPGSRVDADLLTAQLAPAGLARVEVHEVLGIPILEVREVPSPPTRPRLGPRLVHSVLPPGLLRLVDRLRR